MNPSVQSDRDWLLRYLGDELNERELAEFDTRVRTEPAFARQLLLLAGDEETLRQWATLQTTLRRDDRVHGSAPDSPRFSLRNMTRRAWWPGLLAAVLLVAVGVWALNRPPIVAHVADQAACVWEGSSPSTVRAGDTLNLRDGIATLHLSNGVQLVLEGPASLILQSAQRAELLAGRLFADVPEPARGFTVQTPDGSIVDLGTRFGVEVTPAAKTEVHVFDGHVLAKPAETTGTTTDLRAGQAAAVRAGNATVEEVELASKFWRHGGTVWETFDYSSNPLAGQSGWYELPIHERSAVVNKKPLPHRHLSATPKALEVQPRPLQTNPVGRRWRAGFGSALVQIDDDFAKNLLRSKDIIGTLISWSSADWPTADDLQLVVAAGATDDRLRLGFRRNETTQFAPGEFPARDALWLVWEVRGGVAKLWVEPSPATTAQERAPPAILEMPLQPELRVNTLWLGDAANPHYAQWVIDELRGGDTWAGATTLTAAP